MSASLLTTVTIDAHQTMSDARVRIEGIPDHSHVIVRRRDGLDLYWYQLPAGSVREMAEAAPDGLVIDVLNLHESGASPSYQYDQIPPDQAQHGGGIVLDGARAVGILSSGPEEMMREASPPPVRSTRMGRRSPEPDSPRAPAGSTRMGRRGPTRGLTPVEPTDNGGAEDGGDETDFSAFPDLSCPAQVAVGDAFDLVVKLASEATPDTMDGAVRVPTGAPEFDLVVQIVADGFSTDQIRDVLHVVRTDLAANEARFTLTADPIEGAIRSAILQVDFSFGGELSGRAYRGILVTREPSSAPAPAPSTSSTVISTTKTEDGPDLTITISENDDSTQLEWQFTTSLEDVELVSTQVRKRFKGHNAKSFAMQQIRLAHQSIGDAAVGNRMLGIARTIANEMPPEAWSALAGVWAAAKAKGSLPSVLLVSSDPYIPWELASTEDVYVGDASLVDRSLPQFLGAQIPISRWAAPQPRGAAGLLNPPLPPPTRLAVKDMALVIGDYLVESGQRDLPKAKEEGDMLAAKYQAKYQAIRLTATLEKVDPLFDATLEHNGEKFDPQIVHFACHGQIDPNPGFNGIVLNEGNVRLDALYVAGNKMESPFVFLNACQIGQATELLDDAGGMAAAFLKTGASGFVAPLWSVDDQVAQDTAIGFYKTALEQGVPVAEVLRQRRAQFDPDIASPQTTHLAYVYYGHPRLVLSRAE